MDRKHRVLRKSGTKEKEGNRENNIWHNMEKLEENIMKTPWSQLKDMARIRHAPNSRDW